MAPWVSQVSLELTCRAGALSPGVSVGEGSGGGGLREGGVALLVPAVTLKGLPWTISAVCLGLALSPDQAPLMLATPGLPRRVFGPAHRCSQGGLSPRAVVCQLLPAPHRAWPAPTMRLTWKERVMTALLAAAVASGVITLILILVEATNVLLPTDTKVHPRALRGEAGLG